MRTPYDWITVALFAIVAGLFFRRALGDGMGDDALLPYLPPALGCAFANHLGNKGYDAVALALLAGVIAWTWHVLKPFGGDE